MKVLMSPTLRVAISKLHCATCNIVLMPLILPHSLQGARFPVHLLPTVVQVPCVAGLLKENWHGIREGTPVGVAMGDLQCSVLAARPGLTDAGKF